MSTVISLKLSSTVLSVILMLMALLGDDSLVDLFMGLEASSRKDLWGDCECKVFRTLEREYKNSRT
jgi:hypothetical protein